MKAHEVIETIKSSSQGRDPDVLFIKFCLMQQSLSEWLKHLSDDSTSVAAFYEPGALFRDSTLMGQLIGEIRSLCEARPFRFDLKAAPSLATYLAGTAVVPSAVASTASNFALGAFGLGLTALTAASEAARGGLENVKKNSEKLLSAAASATSEFSKAQSATTSSVEQANRNAPTAADSGADAGEEDLKAAYNKEKQERLSLQVELVSVKHARDVEVAALQAQNLMLVKNVANLKDEIAALREELAESLRRLATSEHPK
ncbi:hypothetical protein HK405_003041 [Cladochytrium tenue]|nr:hypothetical protein HK405_003041 [Cladochytrium tenue]